MHANVCEKVRRRRPNQFNEVVKKETPFGNLSRCATVTVCRNARLTGLDCTRRNANGLYGRGCSSKFMRCHDGKLYVYKCSKNRKFNVETAKCEEPGQVIACINK
ncbi:hypothetical protein WUBG_08948 [Wuchereria bancrofti]|uniref:Chitin-binding type-2 domain-containing protein n=1 Tax=Wuchereria bancrofti TaxID=6293 RepID=J9AZX0_WUCBA|nr:hypothetical protein WUBG_08948 [Wuchereria bancrofti]